MWLFNLEMPPKQKRLRIVLDNLTDLKDGRRKMERSHGFQLLSWLCKTMD